MVHMRITAVILFSGVNNPELGRPKSLGSVLNNGQSDRLQVMPAPNAGNMLVAHQLACAGLGIALLPDFMIKTDLETGRLIRLLPEDTPVQADAWIVSSSQHYRSVAVQTVMNHLAEAAQGFGAG